VAGSSPNSYSQNPGDSGNPNVVYIVNNDPDNSVCVNVGFGQIADAVYPSTDLTPGDGSFGTGTVLGPQGSVQLRLYSEYESTLPLTVSAVTETGVVRIFVTSGAL
jgi:hypothetical protein